MTTTEATRPVMKVLATFILAYALVAGGAHRQLRILKS
jgi:hypothetical protein